jgi:hypothetical protein
MACSTENRRAAVKEITAGQIRPLQWSVCLGAGRKAMQIPILVEPVNNNGYRATCGPPLAVSAEGATREEAVDKLELLLRGRVINGVELVVAEIPARVNENPWVKYAGMFKDDPMFAEVLEIMKENRRKDAEDSGYL